MALTKNDWFELILMVVMLLMGFLIGVTANPKKVFNPVVINDTTYNHTILDSIQYNIIKKDSIIYNLKIQMKYEIEESKNLNDTAAVNLFKWLSTSADDYPNFSTGK